MNYWIFLDDVRQVSDVKWINLPKGDWTVIRDYHTFKNIIWARHNAGDILTKISFDHDLGPKSYDEISKSKGQSFDYDKIGGEKTGVDCARFLIEFCDKNQLELPEIFVHSMNPVGRENIIKLFDNYKKYNK